MIWPTGRRLLEAGRGRDCREYLQDHQQLCTQRILEGELIVMLVAWDLARDAMFIHLYTIVFCNMYVFCMLLDNHVRQQHSVSCPFQVDLQVMATTMESHGLAPLHSAVLHFNQAIQTLRAVRRSKEEEMKSLQLLGMWTLGLLSFLLWLAVGLGEQGKKAMEIMGLLHRGSRAKTPSGSCRAWWCHRSDIAWRQSNRSCNRPFKRRASPGDIRKLFCWVFWVGLIRCFWE